MQAKLKASDLWFEFITPEGMCGLCAQSGWIDTFPLKMQTQSGVPIGIRRPCICPNGRVYAELETEKQNAENLEPQPDPTNTEPDVQKALGIASSYGCIDGAHHKMWVIDQMIRCLTGVKYQQFIKDYENGEDGTQTYVWDEGIAP